MLTKIQEFLQDNREKYESWLVDNQYGGCHIKILEYLKNIENGVFVEAGACDGIFQSNTKILEDLGWTGLLIEPSINYFNECKNNRSSICENYALVSFDYKLDNIKCDLLGDLILEKKGITLMGDTNQITCVTTTLSQLIERHNINKIDFLCLDVEGYELEVLNGINYNNVDITYVLVEHNSKNYTLNELINLMKLNGFELVVNLSNFNHNDCPTWLGTHQDYLFKKTK
jgi:FkbM family methyltransferase